jgi:hypothetical protein
MIEKVLTWFTKFIDYANKNTWVWKTLATVIGVVLVGALISMMGPLWTAIGGLAGLFASLVSATAGFMGFDLAAMAASGGLLALRAALVATGIGALILIIIGLLVLMITHWRAVWDFVKTAWDGIYEVIKLAVQGIWWYFDTFFIKPFMTVWDTIKGPVATAFSWIGNAITTPFKIAMDAIKSLWNNTVGGFSITLPSWLGGYSFTVPKIGGGAQGPSGASISTDIKPVGPGVGGAVGFGGVIGAPTSSQAHVTINVHGGDPNQVVAALVAHTRRNGPIPVRSSMPAASAFTYSP